MTLDTNTHVYTQPYLERQVWQRSIWLLHQLDHDRHSELQCTVQVDDRDST